MLLPYKSASAVAKVRVQAQNDDVLLCLTAIYAIFVKLILFSKLPKLKSISRGNKT